MTNVIRAPFGGVPARADDPPFDADVTDLKPPAPPAEPAEPERGGGGGGGPDAPKGPRRYGRVTPLGTGWSRGRKAYVFLDADGERQMHTARDLVQRANLLSLFGGSAGRDVLVDLWPEAPRGKRQSADDFDAERAGAELMEACGALGSAEAVELRLGGVWPLKDDLLVHCGDAVIVGADDLGPGFRDGARLYVACQKRPRPAAEAATDDEIGALLEDFKLWTFAPEHAAIAPQILLGLVACGLLGIAIAWRPHVFLRGERGAGKSSLCRLIAYACGAGEPADDLTPAGLRRMFNGRSGLIPLDERESDAAGVAGVVQIMRGASDGDGNVTVQADTDGGGTATFRVGGSFVMAATTLPALTPADASRITVLQMRQGQADRRTEVEAAQARARALHPKLLRRLLDAWPRWPAAWRAARDAAGALQATSRSMDQVGALMAGWWSLVESRPLTPTVAAAEMARFAELLQTRAAAQDEGAGQLVLQHLLGSRIVITERGSDQMTVQAAIERAVRTQVVWNQATDANDQRPTMADDMKRALRAMGASGLFLNALGLMGRGWPWPFDGPPLPGLLVATELPGPRNLFAGSDWPKTAWREPLRDLPGAMVSKRTMKFPAGGPSRVVFVPLAGLGITDDDLRGDE